MKRCKLDIPKFCKDVAMEKDTEVEGKVIHCLKEQYVKKVSVIPKISLHLKIAAGAIAATPALMIPNIGNLLQKQLDQIKLTSLNSQIKTTCTVFQTSQKTIPPETYDIFNICTV